MHACWIAPKFSAALAAISICILALPGNAQSCSNATLQGTYYSLLQGTVSGVSSVELDKIIADGNGGIFDLRTVDTNGATSQTVFLPAYNLNGDCSGTVSASGQTQNAIQVAQTGRTFFLGSSLAGVVVSGQGYRAASDCAVGSLSGAYALEITYGVVGTFPPFTEVGQMVFDGNGNMTFTESENGVIYSGRGVYSISSDCSGTLTQAFNGGSTYHLSIALVEGGKVLILDTDSEATFSGYLEPESNAAVLGQFAFGGGWYSALYFANSNNYAVSFKVNFIGDNGSPLSVPGAGSSTTVTMAAQQSSILEALDSGSLQQGYVSLALPPGVQAYGVFRQSVQGIADQEAVVPLASASSTQASLAFDDTNYTTAVAIVNPSSVSNTVSIQVLDNTGALIGSSTVSLAANSKTESVLSNLSGLSGMMGKRGTAIFSVTSGNVAVLGLRFNGSAFTSLPAVAN